jgi:hypothetical protein
MGDPGQPRQGLGRAPVVLIAAVGRWPISLANHASHTVIAKVTEDGEAVNHAWASFIDGPFVYLVEAESQSAALNSAAVIEAANVLFTKVKGAPAG